MCGIYGLVNVSGKPTQNSLELWEEVARALAVYSTERGLDSSGVARMDADGTLAWTKDVGPAWTLFGRPDWQRVVTPNAETFALIGHTRLATHGAISRENAHPFVYKLPQGGQLCGVHNGVLSNPEALVSNRPVHPVDSANLFAAMAANVGTWGETWRKANGTVAIAVLRTDDRSLTLARNHNPIALAAIKELNVVAFASTTVILEAALASCSIVAKARSMPEFTSIRHVAGVAKSTMATWLSKRAAKRARRDASHRSPARVVAHAAGGGDWIQCASCLTWAPEQELVQVNDSDLCQRCAPYFEQRPWSKFASKVHARLDAEERAAHD